MIQQEEIMDVNISYDIYAKRDIDEYRLWMPFTYSIAAHITQFLNDNFFFERYKPEISVWIGYDYANNRALELSVRIKETGYGEAELFTLDVFQSYTLDPKNFIGSFMARFQRNLIRSAVMEKIELYRNPPKPIVDWFSLKMGGLTLANTAIKLALSFVLLTTFIIYLCLK